MLTRRPILFLSGRGLSRIEWHLRADRRMEHPKQGILRSSKKAFLGHLDAFLTHGGRFSGCRRKENCATRQTV
jgi:hypothetical protein